MEEDKLEEALGIARTYAATQTGSKRAVVARALLELHDEVRRPMSRNGDTPQEAPRRYGAVMARQTWLADTERIQREVFRLDPNSLGYLRDQVFACTVELAECIQEVPWKSARDGLVNQGTPQSIAATVRRDALERAQKELVDALHFLANAAVALGFTDASLWDEYNRVSCANVDRRRAQEPSQ